MNKGYEIRPYQPGDEEEVIKLLQNVFDGWPHLDMSYTSLDHWRWKYQDNPSGIILITLAVLDSEVIGCIHGIPRKIKIMDQVLPCNTGVDMAVRKDFRGRGISSEMDSLITSLERESGVRFVYWITGNPIVIMRDSRHYFSFPHKVVNLVRIMNIDKQLQVMPVENARLIKLSFHVSKLVNDVRIVLRRREPINRRICISEIESFDKRIDDFCDEISAHYNYIVERRRGYLNWRYCDPRAGDFVVKQAEEDDEIIGYSALRINRYREDYPIGFVVDLLTLPDRLDAADALAADAVRYFDRNDINIVNCQMVKGHPYEKVLKSHGFLDSRIKIYIGCKTLISDDMLSQLKKSPARMIYISWGDHDVLPISMPRY